MSKKILIFTYAFAPHTQTFVYNDAVGLSKNNQVLVACLELQNTEKFHFGNTKLLEYKRNWLYKRIWDRLYLYNLSMNYENRLFQKQLNELIRSFQPDIIHCHFGPEGLRITDNLRGLKIPVIVNLHGYDASSFIKESPIYAYRLKSLFQKANVFPTTTSNSLINHLKDQGIESENSLPVYSGIDPNFFQRSNLSTQSTSFTFLQVSGFREKKGHIFTIKAFKKLLDLHPKNSFKLVFVGGGEKEAAAKMLCKSLGIATRVFFEGWASPQKVKSYLELANCFIHPSVTPPNGDMESTTIAIMEAMSMELPILSTYHSGIPELVENGKHGILVEEKNIDQYVLAMQSIIDWGLQPQNRQHIIDNFSQAKRLQKLLKFYDYAIEKMNKDRGLPLP